MNLHPEANFFQLLVFHTPAGWRVLYAALTPLPYHLALVSRPLNCSLLLAGSPYRAERYLPLFARFLPPFVLPPARQLADPFKSRLRIRSHCFSCPSQRS
jgi:hypothetical protein